MSDPAAITDYAAAGEPPATIEHVAAMLAALLVLAKRADARYLSVERAANYCSLSPESIRRLLASGKLTALRPVKGKVLLDRNELDSVVLSSSQRVRTGRGMRK